MKDSTVVAPSPEGREGPRDILGVLAWVGRDPGLTPSNKAVLLAVVAHADKQGICPADRQNPRQGQPHLDPDRPEDTETFPTRTSGSSDACTAPMTPERSD